MSPKKLIILTAVISLSLSFVLAGVMFFVALADTNISAENSERFAWEDLTGWWDFYITDSVEVGNTKVTGYASSSFGYISLDCATSPNGNICDSSNGYYGVCNGPGPRSAGGVCANGSASGVLSGWGWNDKIGWISFNYLDLDSNPYGITYGVTVDKATGDFTGYAWNDIVGWISFNCSNQAGGCATSDYQVLTSWRATSSVGYLTSSVFDTQRTQGSLLNNIVWQGDSPGGESCVSFQISVSNSSSGPWSYLGPSGTSDDYYGASCAVYPNGGLGCASPNIPTCVNKSDFINYRYLRYKVKIQTTVEQSSPEISDIILNWSL